MYKLIILVTLEANNLHFLFQMCFFLKQAYSLFNDYTDTVGVAVNLNNTINKTRFQT